MGVCFTQGCERGSEWHKETFDNRSVAGAMTRNVMSIAQSDFPLLKSAAVCQQKTSCTATKESCQPRCDALVAQGLLQRDNAALYTNSPKPRAF